MAADAPAEARCPLWLDMVLRILSIALIPLAIAFVGWHYARETAKAQTDAAALSAKEQLTMNLIDKTSQHLRDTDPAVALAYLRMLQRQDSECASLISAAVSSPAGQVPKSGAEPVSSAVRNAIRADTVAQVPEATAKSGRWFAVLSAYWSDREAREEAAKAARLLAAVPARVRVYQCPNGSYVLTLGGDLESRQLATDYVKRARQTSTLEFGTAYAWPAQKAQKWAEATQLNPSSSSAANG